MKIKDEFRRYLLKIGTQKVEHIYFDNDNRAIDYYLDFTDVYITIKEYEVKKYILENNINILNSVDLFLLKNELLNAPNKYFWMDDLTDLPF